MELSGFQRREIEGMRKLKFTVLTMILAGFMTASSSAIPPAEDHPENNLEIPPSTTAAQVVAPERDDLSQAYARYRDARYEEGARILEVFLTTQIKPDEKEAALVLLGECYYHMIDENPKVNMQLMLNTYEKLTRLFPSSPAGPKALYRVAGILYRQKMFQKAIFQYRKIMRRYPDSFYVAPAMFNMGKSLVKIQEEAKGLKVIQEVVEKYPEHPVTQEVQSYLIDHDMKLKKYQEALQRFAKISYEVILYNPNLRQMYPELMFRFGRYQEARDVYFKLINVYPDDPRASFWMARIGDAYAREKNGQDAIKIYYQTKNRFPGSEGEILADLGILDVHCEEPSRFPFQKIVEGYDQLLADIPKGPLHSLVMMRKAMMFYKNNSLPEAIALLDQFFREYPESPYGKKCQEVLTDAFARRITALYQQGRFPEIVDLMQRNKQYLKLDGLPSVLAWKIAESHYQVAFFHTASVMMERLRKRDAAYRMNETLLFRLGEIYLAQGAVEQSRELFDALLKRFPESRYRGDVYALKGRRAFLTGEMDQTIQYCRRALREKCRSRRVDAYYYLGAALAEQGETEQALQAYQSVLTKGRNDPSAREKKILPSAQFAMGDLLYDLGRKEDAREIYQEAVKSYPDDPNADWAQYRIALIQAEKGNAAAALKTLEGIEKKPGEDLLGLLIRTAGNEIKWQQDLQKSL